MRISTNLFLLFIFVGGCTVERRTSDAATDGSVDSTTTVDSTAGDSTAGDGGVGCAVFESPNRSCEDTTSCAIMLHQSDCCGSIRVMGVNEGAVGALETAEAICRATYPDCGCPVGPTVADDGTSSDAGAAGSATISCQSGLCTTTFAGD